MSKNFKFRSEVVDQKAFEFENRKVKRNEPPVPLKTADYDKYGAKSSAVIGIE